MKVRLYSVFDSKNVVFGQLQHALTDAAAIRSFGDMIARPESGLYHSHPEDFSLFFVGEFDEDIGKLVPSLPQNLVTASALRSVSAPSEERPAMVVN